MDRIAETVPLTVGLAEEVDEEDWTGFLRTRRIQGHFHAWAWRRVLRNALGHRPVYLIARRGGAVTALLPMIDVRSRLFGRSLCSLPFLNGGGVVADDSAGSEALIRHAALLVATEGYAYGELRQRGMLADAAVRLIRRSHKVTMTLPLDPDPDRLFAGFKGKLRSQVRRPIKEGAEAAIVDGSRFDEADLGAFYRVFAENMRDLGTPVLPVALFREALAAFGEQAFLVTIRLGGEPVASGFLVGGGGEVEIIWASSLRRFNHLSVNMLLYWAAIRHAAERGYAVFDFGRCSPAGPTFRFKAQWGAEPIPFHWYYVEGTKAVPDVSPDNPKFRLAIRAWQTLPLGIANRLGPLVSRSLP